MERSIWLAMGVVLLAPLGMAQGVQAYDFAEGAMGPWRGNDTASEMVVEPGVPENRALQITATRPHHTVLTLRGSGATPDFVLTLRFKVIGWEGAPPGVYMYGRRGGGGFRALNVNASDSRVFCYYGQEKPSVNIGSVDARVAADSGWVWAAFACYGDYILGKTWADGDPEPRWQAEGRDKRDLSGECAIGVWTSPREASTARVLFDDIRFAPITEANLEEWNIQPGPWPILGPADLPDAPGVFRVEGRAGLATDKGAVAFDLVTGCVTNLVDRRTGQDFIARDIKTPLFLVRLTKPETGTSAGIDAREFRSVKAEEEDGALVLTFAGHPKHSVSAKVSVRHDPAGAIRLGIALANASDWCVASTRFPYWRGAASLGDSPADDALVLPWSSGALLEAPGACTVSRTADYPGAAFAQFSAFSDKSGGFCWWMEDAEGHCKRFHLDCRAGGYASLCVEHLFPEIAGEDVAVPYDTVFAPFAGDWRAAASLYKAWAKQQPWCTKRLSEREDIPAFLKEGSGIIITGIQNPEGRKRLLGERLEKLPDLMDAYRSRTGLKHMVFVPYGWENRGTWAGINYFPAIPGDEVWREANAALRERGHRTAFLTSGYWWVVRRQETSSGPAFDDTEDFEERKGMCIHKADGTPWYVDNFEKLNEHGSWRGWSAKLCHGSAEAQEAMKGIFLDAAGLGVPLVSFDQEIGGCQCAPCYHPGHGHPPGYGAWMWTTFRDTCAEILREGKPIQPELGLFLENVSELAIPHMSTYWSRQFGEVDVGAAGARGIGLFSYLYHEYVTAIGAACVQGQGQHGTRPHPLLRCRILANNLVRGLIPGPFMHDVPLETDQEWQGLVSRAYFSYCRPCAPFAEYLVLGESCPPFEIDCDDVEVWFWRWDSKHGEPRKAGGPPLAQVPLKLPAVICGCFKRVGGDVAGFVVNTTDTAQDAEVAAPAGRSAMLYEGDGTALGPVTSSEADDLIQIALEPFGVRVLVVDGAQAR